MFIKDLTTGAITLVWRMPMAYEGNNFSSGGPFSSDGTEILFSSLASNLVTGDTNGVSDVFVKNLVTGAVTLVSSDASGGQGNGSSTGPFAFSPDGTKVAFVSSATNLVSGDTNGVLDIFVKDLVTGAITRVSTDASGNQSNGDSAGPITFSPDGKKIAFASSASNLVAGDTNNAADIFVKDLVTGAITRVSTDAFGGQANGASFGTVHYFSPDGTKIVFSSAASNLVPGDTNNAQDIFVKDLITGAITLVSADVNGGQVDNSSSIIGFSPDGTKLLFNSLADNLVQGDTNAAPDLFIKNLTLTPTVTTLEDLPYVFQISDFHFSDPHDNPPNALANVIVTSLPTAGALTLNGVAVAANQAIAASEIAAEHLVFTPAADANGLDYANFRFELQDNGGTADGGQDTSAPATMTINVTPLNTPPSIAGSLTIELNDSVVVPLTTNDLHAVDPDNTPSQLTFTVTGSTNGNIALANNPGVTIASFTEVQLEAGDVVFVRVGTSPTATFSVSLSDGAPGSPVATATVNGTVATVTVLSPSGFDFGTNNPFKEMGAGQVQPGDLNGLNTTTHFTIVNTNASVNRDFLFDGTGFHVWGGRRPDCTYGRHYYGHPRAHARYARGDCQFYRAERVRS